MTLIKSAPSYQKAHGFTLLEMIIVSGVLISFMSLGSKYITKKLSEPAIKLPLSSYNKLPKRRNTMCKIITNN